MRIMIRGITVFLLTFALVALTALANPNKWAPPTPILLAAANADPRSNLPSTSTELTWDQSVILVFDSLKRLEENDKRIEAKVDAYNTAVQSKMEQHTADIASIKAQVAIIASIASMLVSAGFNWVGSRKRNGTGKGPE
jgi:hypothetical protein